MEAFPFVKRRSPFPANVSVFKDIDYLLISHDHSTIWTSRVWHALFADNPQMKLFCGINTGTLIQSWFPAMEVIEAAWYQQYEADGVRLTFLPAQQQYGANGA